MSFETAWEALREAYRARLPERLREVEEAWRVWTSGRGGGPELYRKVHSLNGSAGTYGYRELQGLVAELEALIAPSAREEKPAEIDLREQGEKLLERMRQRIQEGIS